MTGRALVGTGVATGLAALAALLALAAPAAGQGRASTLAMTCVQAVGHVERRGAAVLSTGRHTFERFVADERFCALGEFAEPRWVPTGDAAECPVGYVCRSQPPVFDDFQ